MTAIEPTLLFHPAAVTGLKRAAAAAFAAGRFAAAAAWLQRAIRAGADDTDSYGMLAAAFGRLDRRRDAIAASRAAIGRGGRRPELWINLARLLAADLQFAAALDIVRATLALHPDGGGVLPVLVELAVRLKRPALALAWAPRARRRDPGQPAAWLWSAQAALMLDDAAAAARCAERLVALDPASPDGFALRIEAALARGEDDGAIAAAGAMRRRFPADGIVGLLRPAQVRLAAGQTDRAIDLLTDALPGDATGAVARELADALWLAGRLPEAWIYYEARWGLRPVEAARQTGALGAWRDGQAIRGRHIRVRYEQGFGDNIQYGRFVGALAARGAAVHLETGPALLGLLRRLPGVTSVTTAGAPLPAADLEARICSLPLLLGIGAADLPGAAVPYLSPDPGRLALWRDRLRGAGGLRVALACTGNPAHRRDLSRSPGFAPLRALFAVPGISFFNVVPGLMAEDVKGIVDPARFHDLSPTLRDFDELAAILGAVDLLISCDSAPAHLAGALGRPAWVLLPKLPDPRWGATAAHSAWYPSVRLYRQTRPGDWRAPADRIARDLATLAAG